MNDFWPILLALLLLIGSQWSDAPVVDPVPPVPVPTPVVVDQVKNAWVIVVWESEQQTPAQAALRDTLRPAILAIGHKVRFYDPNMEVVLSNGYAEKAADGFPALFVQTEDGSKTLLNQRLPGTAEDVLAAIKKATNTP